MLCSTSGTSGKRRAQLADDAALRARSLGGRRHVTPRPGGASSPVSARAGRRRSRREMPRGLLHVLGAEHPAQRAALGLHLRLQQQQPLHEGGRRRRAALHVHVDGQEGVDALHHAVDVVHAAGVGARAHADDPARLHHLVVELQHRGRHLAEHGAADDHHVGLARRDAQHLGAEAGDVVARREARRHLDEAAGEAEAERPEGVLAAPGDEVLQAAQHDRLSLARSPAGVPSSSSDWSARAVRDGPDLYAAHGGPSAVDSGVAPHEGALAQRGAAPPAASRARRSSRGTRAPRRAARRRPRSRA